MWNVSFLNYSVKDFDYYIRLQMKNLKNQISYIIMNQDTYCGLFEPAGYHSKEELKMLDENYKKYNKGEYHAEYSTYLGNPIVIWNRLKTGEVDII